MLSESTKQAIEVKCKAISEAFSADHVFFAQVLGRRRHYLAGYGPTRSVKTKHRTMSPNLVLCWQGTAPRESLPDLHRDLAELLERIESELVEEDAAC